MSKSHFDKFIQKAETGAKKKERIRQEKKKVRQETKAYFDQKKREWKEGLQRPGAKIQKTEDAAPKPAFRGRKPEAGGKRYEPKDKKYEERSTKTDFGKPKTQNPKPATPGRKLEVKKSKPESSKPDTRNAKPETVMPLNKFIAHAGVCSRRDAAELVKSGKVLVNQQLITEPGFKVSQADEVKVNGKKLAVRKNLVYILLNKPKDYITTTEDPEGRKTVLDIIKNATTERIYPIGRLDRNTTGVLLLTNDGELAQKLSHPSYEVKKIYEVKLDKPLAKKDFDTILKGVTLEDGFISPDVLAYADPKDKSVIGIEIHSGRNRIVRRIFEALGYDVRNLDRVMYANLTKKNVDRGKWRFLNEKEVRLLKFLNASYTRK